jgi:hypothetical protein
MHPVRQALIVALAGGAALLGTALPTLAKPELPNVGAHRHFIETKYGLVEVGPRFCDDPSLQQAFNQFHFNVHLGANGLRKGKGVEIVARGCSFVAP